MADEQERPKLRLKNGSEVDARSAYVKWQMLTAEQNKSPADLQVLLALARDEKSASSAEVIASLKNRHHILFMKDGDLDPVAREVLLSAYRETPEGIVIVNPFDLKTEKESELLTEIQRRDDLILLRFFREREGGPPGHSR